MLLPSGVHPAEQAADILRSTMSAAELTLTLLEVPSRAVVAVALLGRGEERRGGAGVTVTRGTTTEMSCILLLLIHMAQLRVC